MFVQISKLIHKWQIIHTYTNPLGNYTISETSNHHYEIRKKFHNFIIFAFVCMYTCTILLYICICIKIHKFWSANRTCLYCNAGIHTHGLYAKVPIVLKKKISYGYLSYLHNIEFILFRFSAQKDLFDNEPLSAGEILIVWEHIPRHRAVLASECDTWGQKSQFSNFNFVSWGVQQYLCNSLQI